MDDFDGAVRGRSYQCRKCSRRFLATGELPDPERVCVCGASLSPEPLAPGLYELASRAAETERSAHGASMPQESDTGYGASHGNDASHSGPTGPGDAPADVVGEKTP